MNCPLCRYQESNCHKAYPTRLKKFSTGDWLTARKTDAAAASAGYEVLYHPFNGYHTCSRGEECPKPDDWFTPSSATES